MSEAAEKIDIKSAVTLSIERNVLLKSLSRIQSIVEKRNTIPILSNIKLTATGKSLELTATDMDLMAVESVSASVGQEGSLTVPAQTLYDIVRKLPDGAMIALDTDTEKGQVTLEAGTAKFRLSYLPAEDFPTVAEGDLAHKFTLSSDAVYQLIDKTRFAMSMEETRYYLNGIYIHIGENDKKEKVLRGVATDGHRLALCDLKTPQGAEDIPGVILPRKTANELIKLLDEAAGDIQISMSESKIKFVIDDIVVISKLIDGTFPDYQRVIPGKDTNNKLLEIDHQLLAQAVDRVSTISTEKTKSTKIGLEKGKLTLSSQSPESGTAKETLDVNYEADGFEIGFNSKYVMDMLQQLEGDTCLFYFSNATGPALVEDPKNPDCLFVIMPMRV